MSRILIRSGYSPFEVFDAAEIIQHNSIATNIGNLIYAYSVYRALLVDDETEIVPDYYALQKSELTRVEIDRINRGYDRIVIPLADAFRVNFIENLEFLTKNIRRIKLPVTVVGVGMKAPFDVDIHQAMPFDDAVRDFVKAVLDKSEMIGVRGEITCEYLQKFGLVEGRDVTVIGCPSMYTHGPELHVRDVCLTPDSKVLINNNMNAPARIHNFMRRVSEDYTNYTFIPQVTKELKAMYLGGDYREEAKSDYPISLDDPIYADGKTKFFLTAKSWMDYCADAAISVGPRLHGNVVPLISGVPSLFIAKDARMKELVNYHHMPWVAADSVSGKVRLEDLLEKVDFHEPEKYQQRNFEHFVEFLNINKLDHIYGDLREHPDCPFERRIREIEQPEPLKSANLCTRQEIYERFARYSQVMAKDFREENKRLQKEIDMKLHRRIKRKLRIMMGRG